jgi:hypothetical protein
LAEYLVAVVVVVYIHQATGQDGVLVAAAQEQQTVVMVVQVWLALVVAVADKVTLPMRLADREVVVV